MNIEAYWGGTYKFDGEVRKNRRTFVDCTIVEETRDIVKIYEGNNNNEIYGLRKTSIISGWSEAGWNTKKVK